MKRTPHINELLDYRVYNAETGIFHNQQSIGFMGELTVLAGCNEQYIKSFADFIKDKLPEGIDWNVSFSMMGCQYIGDILERNLDFVRKKDGSISQMAQFEHDFIKGHAMNGFKSKCNLPNVLRDYRCFFSCSTKKKTFMKKLLDAKKEFEILFSSLSVGYRFFDQADLINYIKFIGNNDSSSIYVAQSEYTSSRYLHQQVLSSDTTLKEDAKYMDWAFDKLGTSEKKSRSVGLSVRSMPFEIKLDRMPDLFADMTKPSNAMRSPFLLTVNFDVQPLAQSKGRSSRKLASKRKIASTKMRDWFPTIDEDVAEWTDIVKGQEKGDYKLVNMSMDMLIFTDSESHETDTANCINSFSALGMTIRVNEELQWLSIFNSLPFMRHKVKSTAKITAQMHTVTSVNMATLLPIVADYKGSPEKSGLMLPTFRNQVFYLNNFKTEADNYNMCVSAASGAGKSVFMQALMDNHLQRGGEIYAIDKGRSTKKYAEVNGAIYLQAKDISINPFQYIQVNSDNEYLDASNIQIRDLLSVMASPDEVLTKTQNAALLKAVCQVRATKGTKGSIDDVIDFLSDEHKKVKEEDEPTASEIFKVKYALGSYSTRENGQYGKVFSSERKSMLGDGNPLTILELEDFEYDEDLLKVVVFALMVVISEKMYRSGTKLRKICIIEEGWKLIGDSSPQTAKFIECGYRTARKFNGAYVLVTQDLDDFYKSQAAEAAWNNSGVQIIMRQSAKFEQFIQSERGAFLKPHEAQIISSFMKASTAGFSSIMIKAGGITTFNRLFLDPYKRIMLTTEPNEVEMVNELVKEGMPMDSAVYMVANELYGDEITEGIHQSFKEKIAKEVQQLQGQVA